MQMPELPETSELLTFVRTVEARSISRAARELGVPRPTVGRRLARLEQKLGARLLRRTTRTMALTDAGEALFHRARAVVASVSDARDSVARRDDKVRGLLRVSAPPMGGEAFGGLVADFLAAHPEVRVELETSSRHVDLVAGGFDVAIRASSELAPGLVARNLARTRLLAVASPAYLARAGTPRRAADLAKHAGLVGFTRGEHPTTHWPRPRGGRVRVEARLASNDLPTLREAALRGHGVALLPLALVYDDVTEGRLVPVLPAQVGADVRIAVVYADRELVPPAVRAFVDAVAAWAAANPLFNRPVPECKAAAKARANRRPPPRRGLIAPTPSR